MDLRQALSFIDGGRYEHALRALDRIVAADDRERGVVAYYRAVAHRALADAQHAAAEFAEARRLLAASPGPELKEAMRWSSKDAVCLFNRGCACHNEHDLDRAINNYSAALRIDAGNAFALLDRGLAYQARDRNNPASPVYDERHGGIPDCDRAQADLAAVLRLRPGPRLVALARWQLATLGERARHRRGPEA